ncbi:hypothetical protein Pmani_021889 [Petrolisthes manimaculis]|uniref:Protein deacetylase HDAC6 n=1 Tax=Petrolisthes manimaculis TaxID=1843537 RepID=A0AAE1PEV9_9EUCA|nr:hypothetical protein Pmani_021889 [Petrolisthes manimaculis]
MTRAIDRTMEDKQDRPLPRKYSTKKYRMSRQTSLGSGTSNETGGGGARKLSNPGSRIQWEAMKKECRRQNSQSQEETGIVFDHLAKVQGSISLVRGRTGVVYDERMAKHYCLWDPSYPECPDRLHSILKRCDKLGLLERCERVPAREATVEELLKIHSPSHVGLLSATSHIKDPTSLEQISAHFDCIYLSPSTRESAFLAAGSSLELVDAVVTGRLQNGFGIVRPPGHHALKDEFCGYCYINNVELAARRALDHHKLSKILIVDWDVHHGQATQRAFFSDPRVLYFSIHRFENGLFWPHLRESHYDYVGAGAGHRYNFNVPLNQTGLGNSDYLAIFHQVLLPVAYEFNPELVLVSAGFDAALGCPEGEMAVSPGLYSHLTSSLMTLAQGKVVVLLEGGYCLESLSESAAWTLSALLGDPCPPLMDPICEPSPSMRESILNVISVQRAFWTCFRYQGPCSKQQEGDKITRGKAVGQNEKVTEEMKEERGVTWPKHTPCLTFIDSEEKENYPFKTRGMLNVQSRDKINEINTKLKQLREKECFKDPLHYKLCLAYDSRMTQHRRLNTKDARPDSETPERIQRAWECLEKFDVPQKAQILEPRQATREELELVHTVAHVDTLFTFNKLSEKELESKQRTYSSIYLHPSTNDCALLAVGCLLQIVDNVCNGGSTAGVGVIRPPGHHAEPDKPYGFCFYNNVAVAAKYAIQRYKMKRVLILDWDIHHGNGIQHTFYRDPRVLYISLHRYDHAVFYPSSEEANYIYVGEGEGRGYNINIPWNQRMGDSEYMAAMVQVVLPIAYQFNPEMVFISAGFDAAFGDSIGGYKVTPECYGHMTRLMSSLAEGRLILGLEGGYNPETTSHCLAMCAKALLGDPLPTLKLETPNDSAVLSITDVIDIHKEFWPALCFQVDFSTDDVGIDSETSPTSSGSLPSSSSYPPPESSPSSGTSTPFVSAPSSPEKKQDVGDSQTSPGSHQGDIGDEIELTNVNLTPQQSERQNTRQSGDGSSGESNVGMTEQGSSIPASPSQAVHCEFPSSSATKKKSISRRHDKRYAKSDRVGEALMAASNSKNLLRGQTAAIVTKSHCEVCCNMDVEYGMSSIVEQCQKLGVWQKCVCLPLYHATEAEILAVHTQDEVNTVITPARQCMQHSQPLNHTLAATGSVVSLVREVMSGSVQNGIALLPSERHPLSDQCVIPVAHLSEIAIAVYSAFGEYDLKRVLIVEWLGEGDLSLQSMFDTDPRVLIFSIHLNTDWDQGRGKKTDGKSHNINIGLEGSNLQHEDCYSVFFQVLLPVAYEFSPDLVLISASHQLFLHSSHLHSLFHWQQTRLLGSLAKGHLAVVLKLGKYNEVMTENVAAILCALLDDHLDVKFSGFSSPPSPRVQASILDVMLEGRTSWDSLKYHAQMKAIAFHQPMEWSGTSLDHAPPGNTSRLALKECKVVSETRDVCLVWGEGMEKHWNPEDSTHVEKPQRHSSIVQCLKDFELDTRCHRIKGIPKAGQEELKRVHSDYHLKMMQSLRSKNPTELRELGDTFDSIYFHRNTDYAASLAVGSTLAVVGSVLKGETGSGVAVVRPPGHHAEKEEPCGFCFYNNVAVAALHAINVYGLQRVLILDWDVHHGNGTQHTFENDPRVLYVSIHRYDHASFFPGSRQANYDHVGVGKGQGYNINIPWNKRGMNDGDYMTAFLEVVMPVSLMFKPELVLVSAGFDAAVNDPLGGCRVSPQCYGHMTRLLTCLPAKVVIVLEGGYNLDSLALCVALCTKALLCDPLPPLQPHFSPCQSAVESLVNVVSVHSKFWPTLDFNTKKPGSDALTAVTASLERVTLSSDPTPDSRSDRQGEETVLYGEARGYQEEEGGACGEATGGGGNTHVLLSELLGAKQLYAVVPATWCPHLEQVQPLPSTGLTTSDACHECQDHSENWVCLTCYKVLCGRFVNEHMIFHGVTEQHYMVLSYSDLSVWCYACDQYVDNPVLLEAKRAAHLDKFGEEMPM